MSVYKPLFVATMAVLLVILSEPRLAHEAHAEVRAAWEANKTALVPYLSGAIVFGVFAGIVWGWANLVEAGVNLAATGVSRL